METPIKLVLVGDSGIGKSCLIIRYAKDTFQPTHYSTIGIDFHSKRLQLDGKMVHLKIYDTAGQERFRTMSKSFYRMADGVMLVYDTGDVQSFYNLKTWLGEVEQMCPTSTKRIIVGNKSDESNLVDPSLVEKLGLQARAQVFLVSAKTGEHVNEAFEQIVREVMKDPPESNTSLPLHPEHHGYCCDL